MLTLHSNMIFKLLQSVSRDLNLLLHVLPEPGDLRLMANDYGGTASRIANSHNKIHRYLFRGGAYGSLFPARA